MPRQHGYLFALEDNKGHSIGRIGHHLSRHGFYLEGKKVSSPLIGSHHGHNETVLDVMQTDRRIRLFLMSLSLHKLMSVRLLDAQCKQGQHIHLVAYFVLVWIFSLNIS